MPQYPLFILFFIVINAKAQKLSDTIFVYDLNSRLNAQILPISYDTSKTFGATGSAIGSLGNKVLLPITTPTTNLFPGTAFTNLIPAQKKFNVADYPVRVAVSILSYYGGTVNTTCGGTIVGKDFVLSGAFCGIDIDDKQLADSIVVLPAFDNGACAQPMSRQAVSKIYSCGELFDDIGGNVLMQLESDAGSTTGWVGIAYNQDNAFFTDKVMHKFSHPAGINPFDSTEVYNGDTMYYNYGEVQGYNSWIQVSGGKPGIPGQGGSSFLYTDNSEYFVMGSLAYSSNLFHSRINQETFHVFKDIIERSATGVVEDRHLITMAGPNPFSDHIRIRLSSLPALGAVSVLLFDLSGQAIQPAYEVKGNDVIIYRRELEPGVYLLKIIDEGQGHYLKVIVQ